VWPCRLTANHHRTDRHSPGPRLNLGFPLSVTDQSPLPQRPVVPLRLSGFRAALGTFIPRADAMNIRASLPLTPELLSYKGSALYYLLLGDTTGIWRHGPYP